MDRKRASSSSYSIRDKSKKNVCLRPKHAIFIKPNNNSDESTTPLLLKDKNYFNAKSKSVNLWDNPTVTCKKHFG